MSERILDAAADRFATFGIRRTTMDDIAAAAGVGRATLYRQFKGRDGVVAATISREFERFAGDVDRRLQEFEHPVDRFIEGFVAIVTDARTHPLVTRLLDIEPEFVLPFFTLHAQELLRFNREFLAGHFRAGQRHGSLRPDLDPDLTAELLVRLSQSLLLTPGGILDVDDPGNLRDLARRYLAPALFVDDVEAG